VKDSVRKIQSLEGVNKRCKFPKGGEEEDPGGVLGCFFLGGWGGGGGVGWGDFLGGGWWGFGLVGWGLWGVFFLGVWCVGRKNWFLDWRKRGNYPTLRMRGLLFPPRALGKVRAKKKGLS